MMDTIYYMSLLVPIIIGSDKDIPHAEKIKNNIQLLGVQSTIRVCSAHKCLGNLLKMLGEYESDDKVVCYVTCAGKSNALSAVVQTIAALSGDVLASSQGFWSSIYLLILSANIMVSLVTKL